MIKRKKSNYEEKQLYEENKMKDGQASEWEEADQIKRMKKKTNLLGFQCVKDGNQSMT